MKELAVGPMMQSPTNVTDEQWLAIAELGSTRLDAGGEAALLAAAWLRMGDVEATRRLVPFVQRHLEQRESERLRKLVARLEGPPGEPEESRWPLW